MLDIILIIVSYIVIGFVSWFFLFLIDIYELKPAHILMFLLFWPIILCLFLIKYLLWAFDELFNFWEK